MLNPFPTVIQGSEWSQVNRSMLSLYPGKLSQGWMLEPCQNTMIVKSETQLELQRSSNFTTPPPLWLPKWRAASDYYMRIGWLPIWEWNRECRVVSKREKQTYHITWGLRRVLILDLTGLSWNYCWISQHCKPRNSSPTHPPSLLSELEFYNLKMSV